MLLKFANSKSVCQTRRYIRLFCHVLFAWSLSFSFVHFFIFHALGERPASVVYFRSSRCGW